MSDVVRGVVTRVDGLQVRARTSLIPETGWARPMGAVVAPSVGDVVWIHFENGDPEHPIWSPTHSGQGLDDRYDERYVNADGDSMSDFLTLHAEPTNPMHAVTKSYVDAGGGGGGLSGSFTTTFGNATDTEYTIVHGLGSTAVLVSVIDLNTNAFVGARVEVIDTTSVKVVVYEPPGNGALRAVVLAHGGAPTDKHYVHSQGTASATWTIEHNLGKFPAVSLKDSLGRTFEADLDYPDTETVIVNLSAATSGTAYLN